MDIAPNDWLEQHAVFERAAAERRWKRKQAHRVKARLDRLTIMQDADRQLERRLLNGGTPQGQAAFETGMPWFLSYDLSGNPDYILQYMSIPIERDLPSRIKDSIMDEKIYGDWEGKSMFASVDEIPLPEDKDFVAMYTFLQMNSNINVDPYHSRVKEAWELLSRLSRLRRFVDSRNEEQMQTPLPDGSNLDSPRLKFSWVLHRAWIRTLHYRSLSVKDEKRGVTHLYDILALSLAFLESESIRMPEPRQIPQDFTFITSGAENIFQALVALAKELSWETRPQLDRGQAYSMAETLSHNMQPSVFKNFYNKHLGNVNNIWQLWSSLLEIADDLERRTDVEHVEDVLITKRVVVADEWWHAANEVQENSTPVDWNRAYNVNIDKPIAFFLKKISQTNRYRRDYLLLRDWSKRRPWKQLYYMYDTSPGKSDHLLQPINDFYALIQVLRDGEQDPFCRYKEPSPSAKANILEGLFPVHPVASTDPKRFSLAEGYIDGNCVVCFEDFTPGYVFVKLHCNHLFHYTCIRDTWDQHGVYTTKCPSCRAGEWALHEIAGITPEVLDVWDVAEVLEGQDPLYRDAPSQPRDPPGPHSLYNERENEALVLSEYWDDPDVSGQPPGQPRSVAVEMAQVRERRRRKNAARRQMVPDNIGIRGLAPPST